MSTSTERSGEPAPPMGSLKPVGLFGSPSNLSCFDRLSTSLGLVIPNR
jgi:hypothetical protein